MLVSVFYFNPIQDNREKNIEAIFPKAGSQIILKLLSGQIKSILGSDINITPDLTVNELAGKLVTGQSSGGGISKIPQQELKVLVSSEIADIHQQYGLHVTPNE